MKHIHREIIGIIEFMIYPVSQEKIVPIVWWNHISQDILIRMERHLCGGWGA